MHKALYRKWRPMIFDDVIGQDYIITVLKNQVETGKIGHAYLFTGTRGTGKTTCAKIFSKAVNCERGGGNPCLECSNCKSIANGSAIDVVEIDAASNTGVDNIRASMEESVYLPATCKYRVYIIDEVHMLSTSAFNALLKIMEEPPAHVIFILATTEVHQVPVTIISRCQRFDFSRIDDNLIVEQLFKVAQGEEIELDEDASQVIARLADGGMRDALSIFDQCASFDNHVTREVVAKVSGQADRGLILEIAKAICSEDTCTALSLSGEAHSGSYSFSFITAELIGFFRDAMVIKAAGSKNTELFAAGTDIESVTELANKLTLSQIMFCLDTLSQTLNTLGKAAYPYILFEQCLIKMCTPSLTGETNAILTRLEKLEKSLLSVPANFSPFSAPVTKSAAPEIKEEKKAVKPAPAPTPKAPSEAPKPSSVQSADGKAEFAPWGKVLDILSTTNAPLYGALKMSRAFIEGDVVYIDTNDFSFTLLKSSENNRQTLKAAVAQAAGKSLMIAQYKEKPKTDLSGSNAMVEILKRAEKHGVDVKVD